MEKFLNKHGVEVVAGDYWVMDCPPNSVRKDDETWIMKIIQIQKNGLVPVHYVNWKRKGVGISESRTVDDFGEMSSLRRATDEEIKYYNRRVGESHISRGWGTM